ncbi:MAG: hypothetical protein WAT71_16390 [Ignavibacteria bacterium]
MTGQFSTENNPGWGIDPLTSVTYSKRDYNNPEIMFAYVQPNINSISYLKVGMCDFFKE